jgi:murein DD-endopeptidase MepM/ murein hydrolase activator NlpD
MKKRRRSFPREETVAPWLTLAVILALWWAGAYLLGKDVEPGPPRVSAGGYDTTADLSSEARTVTEAARHASGAARESNAGVAASGDAGDEVARASERRTDASGGETGPIVPVAGVEASSLRSTFDELRGGGSRRHEALDIHAPRGTPVVAAVDGRIAKLFTSAAGGLTLYQFDPEERFCYYYAHLDAYAPDLNEGETVQRGQIIGYVGTTGNARPDTPHLHFAVYRLGPDKKWWEGEPIDPVDLIR